MANISARKNKKGEIISYRIRVSRGYDSNGKQLKPYEMTWHPASDMSAKRIEKEVQKQATLFEEQCRQGLIGDGRQKFGEYAEYVINLKEKSGELRHHTVVRYRELLQRVNQGIGHIKIKDIRPQLYPILLKLNFPTLRLASEFESIIRQLLKLSHWYSPWETPYSLCISEYVLPTWYRFTIDCLYSQVSVNTRKGMVVNYEPCHIAI